MTELKCRYVKMRWDEKIAGNAQIKQLQDTNVLRFERNLDEIFKPLFEWFPKIYEPTDRLATQPGFSTHFAHM